MPYGYYENDEFDEEFFSENAEDEFDEENYPSAEEYNRIHKQKYDYL